ncbi:MAG: ABC transporter ATP-binding protein [Planctomycetota bacterium]
MSSEQDGAPYVVASGLSKKYKIYPTPFHRIREGLSIRRKTFHKEVWALRGITFEVKPGRALGVVGSNGAGKSTLLKVLSGTTLPTLGTFQISKKVASLLELGTGFHSEFTGRDNIFLNASVMGFTRKEIRERLNGIIEFSELGAAIDQPVRTYSSGMVMRLGFSVATAIDPDVLIVDEILAVGDLHFQKKCVDRIFDFRSRGKTIILCSHSLYDIRQVCDEVLWLKDGQVEQHGDPLEVTTDYAAYERSLNLEEDKGRDDPAQSPERNPPRLDRVVVHDQSGELASQLHTGLPLTLMLEYHVPETWKGTLYCAFAIWDARNTLMGVASTGHEKVDTPGESGGRFRAVAQIPRIPLIEGEFTVVGYLYDDKCLHMYDHMMFDGKLRFTPFVGQLGEMSFGHTWHFEKL